MTEIATTETTYTTKFKEIEDFNLDHIFDCGQCFRFAKEEDGTYTGIVTFTEEGQVLDAKGGENATWVNIDYKKETKEVIIRTTKKTKRKFWINYLDMETDYGEIKKKLKRKDAKMKEIISYGEGIRILNQDHWETIVSFIISQNNNIPRIKGCIESLCENFGEPVGTYRGRQGYSFPSSSRLATLSKEEIHICRLGYRREYVLGTSKEIAKKGLDAIKNGQGQEAFDLILQLKGVGPKVAHCILLFSFKERASFPIDVWIRRIMATVYGLDENNPKEITAFAKEKFGAMGGIAQQYLFYYAREREKDQKC